MQKIDYSDIEKYIGQDLLFKQVDDFGKETGEQRICRLTHKNNSTIFGTSVHNGRTFYWNLAITDTPNNLKSNIYLINNFN
jgi:hypothetical protein